MNRDDVITLSDGQTATVIRGDESYLKNSYVVLLNDGQSRVVDKKTLTLVRTKENIYIYHYVQDGFTLKAIKEFYKYA